LCDHLCRAGQVGLALTFLIRHGSQPRPCTRSGSSPTSRLWMSLQSGWPCRRGVARGQGECSRDEGLIAADGRTGRIGDQSYGGGGAAGNTLAHGGLHVSDLEQLHDQAVVRRRMVRRSLTRGAKALIDTSWPDAAVSETLEPPATATACQ
jgi:hypothetical protein